jgi:predicted PurR-regulated permease PerM
MGESSQSFLHRMLIGVGVIASIASLLLILWYAVDVLLLAFAGILIAIFLRGLSDWLSERLPISSGLSLFLVIVSLASLFGIGIWLLAPDVSEQVDQLTRKIPESVDALRKRIEGNSWGRFILSQAPGPGQPLPGKGDILSRITGFFSTTLGALTNLVVILFIGLYVAAQPGLYKNGFVRLMPLEKRNRAHEVLSAVGMTLRWWLIGKMMSMLVVGILTSLGLWLLGMPLALTLGAIAALLTFIPNIGPILSAVPAALLALLEGPTQVLYVLLLYLAIQTVESYFITPLIQKRMVALPPALILLAQVLLGVLVGGLGLILATPLAAAALIVVNMVYIEDVLHDDG